MGTSQTITGKYVIQAKFEVEGVVEKPDVIGAVFGQTEGLFSSELDLRELQKSGRIGRMEINLKSKNDKTTGAILIPTSLDKVSTAIIAATIESIDRIGPCAAKVSLDKIEDTRSAKRKAIVARAKKILQNWVVKAGPDTEIFNEVANSLRMAKVKSYGPEKLTSGPDIQSQSEIIIVEGRADVITLLRNGIQNVIAIEGAKIPVSIIQLCKQKEATAFIDGDRGGDLIVKELLQVTNVKYIARAPKGKEVEELNPKEIVTALQKKALARQIKPKAPARRIKPKAPARQIKPKKRKRMLVPKQIVETANGLKGTLEAVLFNKKMEKMEQLPVSELVEKLKQSKNVDTVVFDGIITQRIVDIATDNNIEYLVAARISDVTKRPLGIHLLTFADI